MLALKYTEVLYSNFLFSLETNGEQNTVDMSLKDLAEAGKIGFPYVFSFLCTRDRIIS